MIRWILITLFVVGPLYAQQPKNVKVLTGMSRPEVQRVMNVMRAGLGVHCHYCHVVGQDPSVDGTPQKAKALEMMRMVVDLNGKYFGGKEVVTCFTCHNGTPRPKTVPPLPQPLPPDVTAAAFAPDTKNVPAASAVLQKYIAAVGRVVPASEPRTIMATRSTPLGGPTSQRILDTGEEWRVDVTLPDGSQLIQVLTPAGGWIKNKQGIRELNAEELVAVRMGRRPFAPFTETSFGGDATVSPGKVGDANVWVVTTADAEYSFDTESGLLLRRILYLHSPMGRIPERTDFDHYRDVGGAKVPFTMRVELVDPWLGGTRQATSIVIGTPIAPTEFAKPQ